MYSDLSDLHKSQRPNAVKKSRRERINKMRAALPGYTLEEIISYRLPTYEGVVRVVEQKGCHNTAYYLKKLTEYQENMKKAAGPDSLIALQPNLKDEESTLKTLADGLCKAEEEHFKNKTKREVTIFVMMAISYLGGDENWWWLGHQLVEQAVSIAEDYKADGGQLEAIAQYVLGKCLARNRNDIEGALYHLMEAKNLSRGKTWVPTRFYPKERDTVFSHVCLLIHEIKLKMAKNFMKIDTPWAIELCQLARDAALDACDYSAQSKAYIMMGQCELLMNDTENAVISFQKALAIQKYHENVEMMCETLCHLGTAYIKHGYFLLALKKFEEMKNYAERKGVAYYEARANKYLGEYYLQEGSCKKATPYLHRALQMFARGNHADDAEATRNVSALSIGVELLSPYIKLVMDCNASNPNYANVMKKLLGWKDHRETFWDESVRHTSFSNLNVQNYNEVATPSDTTPSTSTFSGTEVEVIYRNKGINFSSRKSADFVPEKKRT